MEGLPLNERDFLQLALLLPGTTTPVEGSQLSTRGDFAMHANGGREENNNFLLDGVDNNDSDVRGYVLQPSVDAIQEFKIATNSYSAEYGVASAGQVNIITRSGSNEFHGTLYDYLRNRDLDARNFFDGSDKPQFIRNQFGAALGGPIVKNSTFFFASYEGLQEGEGLTQLGTVPTLAVRAGKSFESRNYRGRSLYRPAVPQQHHSGFAHFALRGRRSGAVPAAEPAGRFGQLSEQPDRNRQGERRHRPAGSSLDR